MLHHKVSTQKSTNVRVLAFRRFTALLSRVAPVTAARLAERLFVTPLQTKQPSRERAWADVAEKTRIPSPHGPIPVWMWGRGRKTVVLVHGWSGRGLQLGAMVEPLVELGYRVVTYDAPGHGLARGRTSSLLLFASALGLVARRFSPVRGLVAHSLGATAAIYALAHRELAVERMVAIAPSARLHLVRERFGKMTGFSEEVVDRMRGRFEKSLGFDWEASEPLRLAEGMPSSLLLIHDEADPLVPHRESAELAAAWPGARLLTTSGLGHHRVLRDSEVIASAAAFFSQVSATNHPPMNGLDYLELERKAS